MIDKQAHLLEFSAQARGFDGYYDRPSHAAIAQVAELHLAAEPQKVREALWPHDLRQSCLLARRLVEAGTKFVTAYFAPGIGGQSTTEGGWDTHGFNNTRMFPIIEKYHLPMTEQSLPTLLTDLDERGLLDTTLVVGWASLAARPTSTRT